MLKTTSGVLGTPDRMGKPHHEIGANGQPQAPLDDYRAQLDGIDHQIMELIARRLDICRDVARYKKREGIPMMQPARVEMVKQRAAQKARGCGVDERFARNLYGLIIDEACRLEDVIIDSQ